MPTQKNILLSLPVFLILAVLSTANAIENDPAKEYMLTDKHGPWMIMVGTFSDVRDRDTKKEGLTAREAANALVHELRGKGIPAYLYFQDSKREKIDTYDRLGNKDQRVYTAQFGMVCVLAGNYPKIEDPVAQKTLTFVKRYKPKFLNDPKSGANVRDASGTQKGPFGGAFLTINPSVEPAEVVRRKVDNDTKYFNSNIDYPLVDLKHKYTLKVATFTGKSVVPVGNSEYSGREGNFDKNLLKDGPYTLARAGEDATQLTYAMRQNSAATRKLGSDRFEAYVYHDKFQSYVTVGGFDSKDDPAIKNLAQIFMAKYQADDRGEYALVAESLKLPGKDAYAPPLQTWAFDPGPELIEVPRIR